MPRIAMQRNVEPVDADPLVCSVCGLTCNTLRIGEPGICGPCFATPNQTADNIDLEIARATAAFQMAYADLEALWEQADEALQARWAAYAEASMSDDPALLARAANARDKAYRGSSDPLAALIRADANVQAAQASVDAANQAMDNFAESVITHYRTERQDLLGRRTKAVARSEPPAEWAADLDRRIAERLQRERAQRGV